MSHEYPHDSHRDAAEQVEYDLQRLYDAEEQGRQLLKLWADFDSTNDTEHMGVLYDNAKTLTLQLQAAFEYLSEQYDTASAPHEAFKLAYIRFALTDSQDRLDVV